MQIRRYSTEGVVLARRNYGEADRILVLYTKHFGKLHVIAKGVRKPKSKKRGSIEVFSQIKFAASRGKGLDIITETDLLNSFQETRKELKRTTVAYFFVEVIGRLTQDGEENIGLYNLLVKYLKRLQTSNNLKKLRLRFINELLVSLGFWPAGKIMNGHDKILEEVIEREVFSKRVGKKLLS